MFLLIASFAVRGGIVHAQNPAGPPDSSYYPAYNWSPEGSGWGYSAPQHLRYPPAAGFNTTTYNYDGSNPSGDIENLCSDNHPGAKKLLVPNMGAVFPGSGGFQTGAYSYDVSTPTIKVEYWATAYQCWNSPADPGSSSLQNTSLTLEIFGSNGYVRQSASGAFDGASDPTKGGNGGNWKGYGANVNLSPGLNAICMKTSGTYSWTQGGVAFSEPFGPLGFTDRNCIQVFYNQPPVGVLEITNCNSLEGWALDPDNRAANVFIQVFKDGQYIYGAATDVQRDDINAAYPGSGAATHGFKVDISGYKDAYAHTYEVYALDAQDGRHNTKLGAPTIAVCAPPTCSLFSSIPDIPESGQAFTGNAGFSYVPGGSGKALYYDMGLDINGVRKGSVSRQYSTMGDPSFDGSAIPGGATRTNQITVNNIVVNSLGAFTPSWQMQWALPNDNVTNLGTAMNTLINMGSPYGVNDARATTGLVYGTLRCGSVANTGQSPYVKVYGNDVAAGGKFADVNGQATFCSATDPKNKTAGIYTFSKKDGSNNFGGGGSQFGALALGKINSFGSSDSRNGLSPPNPPDGMSFGNMIRNAPVAQDQAGDNGFYHCAPDYYSAAQNPLPDKSIVPDQQIGNGQHIARFVNGDAYIFNNIAYTSNSWGTISEIPSYYLIVKGDIYINSSVTNLDGVYVAQPINDTKGGHIYTCTKRNFLGDVSFFAPSELYDSCKTPLTITGSFIANQIRFLRTNGTVGKSLTPDVNEKPTSGNIAEIFNFSQEMYLAPQPDALSSVIGGKTKKQYDAITSLPPIL